MLPLPGLTQAGTVLIALCVVSVGSCRAFAADFLAGERAAYRCQTQDEVPIYSGTKSLIAGLVPSNHSGVFNLLELERAEYCRRKAKQLDWTLDNWSKEHGYAILLASSASTFAPASNDIGVLENEKKKVEHLQLAIKRDGKLPFFSRDLVAATLIGQKFDDEHKFVLSRLETIAASAIRSYNKKIDGIRSSSTPAGSGDPHPVVLFLILGPILFLWVLIMFAVMIGSTRRN